MTLATIPGFRILNLLQALLLMHENWRKKRVSLSMLTGSFAIFIASSYYTPLFYNSAVRAFHNKGKETGGKPTNG